MTDLKNKVRLKGEGRRFQGYWKCNNDNQSYAMQ